MDAQEPQQPRSPPKPGNFDNIHNDTKGLFMYPNQFHDGFKFHFGKMVGTSLHVAHGITVGKDHSAYNMSAAFLGPNRPGPGEASPVVTANMDTEGTLQCAINNEFTPALRGKLQAHAQGANAWNGYQGELDYHGKGFCASIKVANLNPWRASGICILNYLQDITPHLSLGGEYLFQRGPHGEMGVLSFGGMYKSAGGTAAATVSPHGVAQVTCMRRVSPKLSVGAELDINLGQQHAVSSLGAAYTFRTATVHVQANTEGIVSAMLEKHLVGPNVTLGMGALLNHAETKSAFGLSFNINM